MFALVLLLVSQAHYVACLESSFNSELVENVCKIKSNTTLKNDFYDYVKNAYIPPGSSKGLQLGLHITIENFLVD